MRKNLVLKLFIYSKACLFAGEGKVKQGAAVEEFRTNPDVTVMCVVVRRKKKNGKKDPIFFFSCRKPQALWD